MYEITSIRKERNHFTLLNSYLPGTNNGIGINYIYVCLYICSTYIYKIQTYILKCAVCTF